MDYFKDDTLVVVIRALNLTNQPAKKITIEMFREVLRKYPGLSQHIQQLIAHELASYPSDHEAVRIDRESR